MLLLAFDVVNSGLAVSIFVKKYHWFDIAGMKGSEKKLGSEILSQCITFFSYLSLLKVLRSTNQDV